FSRAALRAIHGRSGGVPRLINMLCHRAMLAAFAAERRTVTLRSVWRAYREVATLPLPGRAAPAPRGYWPSAALAVGVVGLAVGAVGVMPRLRSVAPGMATRVSSPPAADALPEPPALGEAAADPPAAATVPDPPAVAALAVPPTGGDATAGEVTTDPPPAPDPPAAARHPPT